MEGHIQNMLWPLPTQSHVLWPLQFPRHLSNVHEHAYDRHTGQTQPEGTEIIVYMDNILIATKEGATIEDHRAATWDVFQVLQDHDLFLKPEKCVRESPHIDYLGLILEEGVTHMDPAKVNSIKSWPTPTMVKQVRCFLGFCNFYCAFI